MDLSAIIRELHAETERLEWVIANLEALERAERDHDAQGDGNQPHIPRGRGRTSMGSEERQQVSQRMRAYWASKRKR